MKGVLRKMAGLGIRSWVRTMVHREEINKTNAMSNLCGGRVAVGTLRVSERQIIGIDKRTPPEHLL